MKNILIYGYGNPGRQDDGLGVMLADRVGNWAKDKQYVTVKTDTNYQLNIEDAYDLDKYDVVVFADASIEQLDTYLLEELKPKIDVNFSMHSVSPGFVLGVAKEMYEQLPQAYLLHIKGYEWEFMVDPTEGAKKNLDQAYSQLTSKIERWLM